MPFQSDAQRRFLWLKHPDIAQRWADEEKRAKKRKLKVGKLSDHVRSEQDIALMHGKSKGPLVSNTGMTPAPYDAVPDYAEIYYQPDGDTRKEDETEARKNRREAMGVANRGKYGFHGTADAEDVPILRYETDDFPQNGPRRNPSPNERRASVVTPNKYPQEPVQTGPVPKLGISRAKFLGKLSEKDEPVEGEHQPDEVEHPHEVQSSKAPSTIRRNMIEGSGGTEKTVKPEPAVRYVASTKIPPTSRRMGR